MEHFWNGWSSYIPWSLWCLIRNLTGFIFCRQHGHLWQPSLLLVQRLICLLNFVIPVLMIRFLDTFIKFWLFLKKSCVILIEKLLFIHVLKIYHCIKIDLWLTCIWFFCAIILLKSRQRQIKVEAPALLNKHRGSHSLSNLLGFYFANNFKEEFFSYMF